MDLVRIININTQDSFKEAALLSLTRSAWLVLIPFVHTGKGGGFSPGAFQHYAE